MRTLIASEPEVEDCMTLPMSLHPLALSSAYLWQKASDTLALRLNPYPVMKVYINMDLMRLECNNCLSRAVLECVCNVRMGIHREYGQEDLW